MSTYNVEIALVICVKATLFAQKTVLHVELELGFPATLLLTLRTGDCK